MTLLRLIQTKPNFIRTLLPEEGKLRFSRILDKNDSSHNSVINVFNI